EVRKLQVLEEEIEELVLGKREDEIVLSLAVRARLASAAASTAALRLRDEIADLVVLVPRQDHVARAAVTAVRERWLAHALRANRDLLGAFDLGHLALLERVLDGLADVGLGPANKALPVTKALGFGVEPTIDNVH